MATKYTVRCREKVNFINHSIVKLALKDKRVYGSYVQMSGNFCIQGLLKIMAETLYWHAFRHKPAFYFPEINFL